MADRSQTSKHPLSPDVLLPLSADAHGSWRMVPGDFGFAIDAPFIPIVAAEFPAAARSYPIVFAAADHSPLAVLGLERTNLFVGTWASTVSTPREPAEGAPSPESSTRNHHIPAFVRRYPFGFLQAPDGRFALGIHEGCGQIRIGGEEGVPLFVDGKPGPLVEHALAFCAAFQAAAEATMDFVAALDERRLLLERQADITLADGRKLGLAGFRIVDQQQFQDIDGPTIAEWHAKGWLALVHHHLASLDLLRPLVHLQSARSAATQGPAESREPLNALVPMEG